MTRKKKEPELSIDGTTVDNISNKLVHELVGAQQADGELEMAKETQKSASDRSIRGFATVASGINYELLTGDIVAIADRVAGSLANGSDTVHKARKRDVKLMLEQRSNILPVIEGLDELSDKHETAINIRQKTLSLLSRLRKDDTLTPQDVLQELDKQLGHDPDDIERLEKAIASLSKQKAICDEDGDVVPDAKKHLESLLAIAKGEDDPHAQEAAGEPPADPDEAPADEEPDEEPEPAAAEAEDGAEDEPEDEGEATPKGKSKPEPVVDEELLGFDMGELFKRD